MIDQPNIVLVGLSLTSIKLMRRDRRLRNRRDSGPKSRAPHRASSEWGSALARAPHCRRLHAILGISSRIKQLNAYHIAALKQRER